MNEHFKSAMLELFRIMPTDQDIKTLQRAFQKDVNEGYRPDINHIFNAVSTVTRVPLELMRNGCRKREISDARHLFAYFATKKLRGDQQRVGVNDITYDIIGKFINRDHSTIMYGVGKIEALLEHNHEIQEMVEMIENRLTLNIEL